MFLPILSDEQLCGILQLLQSAVCGHTLAQAIRVARVPQHPVPPILL